MFFLIVGIPNLFFTEIDIFLYVTNILKLKRLLQCWTHHSVVMIKKIKLKIKSFIYYLFIDLR